jgi:hypothetical protein
MRNLRQYSNVSRILVVAAEVSRRWLSLENRVRAKKNRKCQMAFSHRFPSFQVGAKATLNVFDSWPYVNAHAHQGVSLGTTQACPWRSAKPKLNSVFVRPRAGALGCNVQELAQERRELQLEAELCHDVNERLLFHGTTYENADSIVSSGFDFRKCGCGMHGDGAFCASQACKSHQYTCPSGCVKSCSCCGERSMMIASVVLGDPFYTETTMWKVRHLPCRAAGTSRICDL